MQKRKKRWGDRWDGYRLRDLDPVHVMMPYLFGSRIENEAVLGEVVDLTEVDKYLAQKNAQNPEFKYTWFHFIAAVTAKTILLRPKMNYFIAGGRFYERNRIEVAFNVKRQFTDESKESMAKFVLDPEGESPMEQVHTYVQKFVTKVRKEDASVGVDDTLKFLSHLPRFCWRILGWTMKKLEYYGHYPKSLAADDPCYSSAYISNLGSIQMNADYHHLFNWGTISFFMTIGQKKMRPYYKEDGTCEMRDTIKLGLTVDERIADGYYYAKTLRLMRKMFANPALLDLPANTPIEIE